jgi:hypothetical protein
MLKGRGFVHQVAIVFKSSSQVTFTAQEFDIDLSADSLSSAEANYSEVHKLTYKDSQGNDSLLYLNPTEVAGIAVAPIREGLDGLQTG